MACHCSAILMAKEWIFMSDCYCYMDLDRLRVLVDFFSGIRCYRYLVLCVFDCVSHLHFRTRAIWFTRFTKLTNTTSTNCHWVLEHNSQIIGGVGLKAGASSTEGTLTRMFIVPEYRRQGLSTILLDTLVQHCKECRLKKVQLTTLAAQPAACAMYGKYGFIQGDTRPYRFGLLFHLTDLVDFTLPLWMV